MAEDVENTQEQAFTGRSSVEVKKNSKGYIWSVKVYDDDPDKALSKMIELELKCQKFYGTVESKA